jgi:beta-N-acetylhexosaminidase
MVGHAHYPFLDPDPTPASCSPHAIEGLLRQELGYRGVAIADDLEMGAVSQGEGWLDAAVSAIAAGCDQVLVCHTRERMFRLRDEIARRVKDGSLPASRVAEAARRVHTLRGRALPPPPFDSFPAARQALADRFGVE